MNPRSKGKPEEGVICALLVILVFAVFGQTLHFDFVDYDDNANICDLPQVTGGLSLHGVAWAFTHSQVGHWDPLTTLSHMVDCQLYGLHAWGHHLDNVLLHTVTVVLLFVALREMTGCLWRSAFVAAVFAIHPLRAESVAWVTERKDMLSGLFFMLTLLAYVGYVRHPESKRRYWTLGTVFVLGLMSKSMLVTVPFVLLLLDYWPLKRWEAEGWRAARRLIMEKVPLLLLSMAFAGVQVFADRHDLVPTHTLSMARRLMNACFSCALYIREMVWPVDLAAFYPHPGGGLPMWQVVLAMAVLGALSAGALLAGKKQPWLLVGWLWYVGMLAPVIGIVQAGRLARADRYTYLPQIGLCLAGTWAVADWAGKWRYHRLALGGAAAVVLCALAVAAHQQTSYWRDSVTLWTHTVGCTKDNAVADYNLGQALFQQGRTAEAIPHYREALRIDPGYAEAHDNLGAALFQQGRTEEAIAHYREALRINPASAEAHNNLANALRKQGRMAEPIAHYREALRIDPAFAEAHYNLGFALFQQGRTAEAIAHYNEALRINPAYAEAHNNLGAALFRLGRTEEAIARYGEALRINPAYAEAHNNLGGALFQQGRAEEAIARYREALRINPNYESARYNLGGALFQQGRLEEATEQYREALRINPADADARYNLGEALAQQGRPEEALLQYKKALELAEAQSNTPLADALRKEIKLYEAGRRFEDAR